MKRSRSLTYFTFPSSSVKLSRKMTAIPNRQASGPSGQNNQQKPKKPQLTHFLCLPLVNAISLPQLESSLMTFKQTIPFCPRSKNESALKPPRPLIPDGAVRPIGTLHLTLGVMSLTSKERLDDAVELLQRLDLVHMIREAERIANANAERGGRKQKQQHHLTRKIESASGIEVQSGDITSEGEMHGVLEPAAAPQPFTLSLESLHALPRAKDATVLHAVPVDPTSRLYPFCVMLRDKFLEAGFLLGEHKNKAQVEEGETTITTTSSSQNFASTGPLLEASTAKATSQKPGLPQRPPADTMVDSCNENTIPKHLRKPEPRPLLLHATVVNTIYVKGRQRGNNNKNNNDRGINGKFGRGNNNNNNKRYSFDARDIVAYYRDYYLDNHRTRPRTTTMPSRKETTEQQEGNTSDDGEDEKRRHQQEGKESKPEKETGEKARYPFIWAKDFPLEKICICEMGAKKIDLSGSSGPVSDEHVDMAGRLGEQYRAVAERSLLFS